MLSKDMNERLTRVGPGTPMGNLLRRYWMPIARTPEISDRTTERLGTSDKGVILFRNLLLEQMEKVEKGEDPMGIVRDPAKNEPYIVIGREKRALDAFAIRRELTRAADREVAGAARV